MSGGACLLRVTGPLQLGKVGLGVDGAQEDGLELVHAGVGKQERRVGVRHHAAAGDWGVPLGLEELYEGGPDPVACVPTAPPSAHAAGICQLHAFLTADMFCLSMPGRVH